MLSNEDKERILQLRISGLNYKKIREITGISKSTISDICRSSNLGGNQIKEITSEIISKTQELYDSIGNIKKSS